MKPTTLLGGGAFALALLLSGRALAAGHNDGPPAGPVIFDLAGQANPHDWTQYTASFVATTTSTDLSFAFRDDRAYLYLDDVVLTTGGGPNLVVNGGFEAGPLGAHEPTGWTYLNPLAVQFGGDVVDAFTDFSHTGLNAYRDGALQGYDTLGQTFATVIGATYELSFFAAENGLTFDPFQQVSTNGDVTGVTGNGMDILVYAAPSSSAGVPEPATWAFMTVGLLGVGVLLRGRSKLAAISAR